MMGVGCKAVRCVSHEDVDVVIGEWNDGRIGLMRCTRFKERTFGCVVHTEDGARCAMVQPPPLKVFSLMLEEVVEFFRTGMSPIDIEETFDIIAFLETADCSKQQGGKVLPTVGR